MAGETFVQGAQPVEYAEEADFGVPVADDTTWNWIGYVTSVDVSVMAEEEIVGYLPAGDDGFNLERFVAEKASEMYEVDITYHPQDLDFFQYFTGMDGGTSPEITPIQLGLQDNNNDEFSQITGLVGEEISLSIEEDSAAEVSCSFIGADATDWVSEDYVGTEGEHSSEDPSDMLVYDDLSNVTWGGTSLDHAIESLDLTISNDLEIIKDPDSQLGSHIEAIVPTNREITTELSITYSDMQMANDVRDFTRQDLAFEFGPNDENWTVGNQAFPEFPFEFGPEDMIADSISSIPADSLTYV